MVCWWRGVKPVVCDDCEFLLIHNTVICLARVVFGAVNNAQSRDTN